MIRARPTPGDPSIGRSSIPSLAVVALVVISTTSVARADGDMSQALRFAQEVMGDDITHGFEDLIDSDPDEALSMLLARDYQLTEGDEDPVVDTDGLGIGLHTSGNVLESLGNVRLNFTAIHPFLVEAAAETKLPVALIDAVVRTESGYRPHAVSRKGARGLMQLMPETAREYGVQNPFDPRDNILGGARYLRRLLDQFGDLKKAVAAYNAGPAAVQKHDGVPPFVETLRYVETVLRRYHLARNRS